MGILVSCDLFSTLPFQPVPQEMGDFSAQAFRDGFGSDPVRFRLTESCLCGVGLAPFSEIEVKVTSLPNSEIPEFQVESIDARPLRPSQAWASFFGYVGDTAVFLNSEGDTLAQAEGNPLLALPSSAPGPAWVARAEQGEYEAERRFLGLDTLQISGILKEAWLLQEILSENSKKVVTRYIWLGAEGPLKGQEDWENFRYRSLTGSRSASGLYRREWTRL
jgi:hypothetical protein